MRPFSTRSLLLAALLTAGATACSDTGVTAPSVDAAAFDGPAFATATNTTIDFKVLYPTLTTQIPSVTLKGDTTIQRFSVDPEDGRLVVFGRTTGHVLAIPANTICDPEESTYGPAEWLKSCELAEDDIYFEVKTWTGKDGRPNAQFKPDVRFRPSAPQPVRLYFKDVTLTSYTTLYIPYCNAFNVCVNEGLTDKALETYVSPLSGGGFWVYRTLRHFSGYTVTAD